MIDLKELKSKLYPCGVLYKTLGECCDFNKGSPLARKNSISGAVPVVSGGVVPTFYHNSPNREKNTITIAASGSAGYVSFWTVPIFCADAFSVDIKKDNELNKRYLYHFLLNNQNKIYRMRTGAVIPHVYAKDLSILKIPLPPLIVQKEIAEILDKFETEQDKLILLLNQELKARKKQYEYYRDKLLTFSVPGVPFYCLDDLGKFYSGLTAKSKKDFVDGNETLITYKNVYFNLALNVNPKDKVKISPTEKQRTLEYGDVIFTGSSETPDECGLSSVVTTKPDKKLYLNSFCFIYRFNDLTNINPDFYKHLFRSSNLRRQINKTANGVIRFNVSREKMKKVKIPIPPLEEQKRIAAILDKFEALCNDLSQGIPAEVNARQKQYEYYRGKLLTFEELKT